MREQKHQHGPTWFVPPTLDAVKFSILNPMRLDGPYSHVELRRTCHELAEHTLAGYSRYGIGPREACGQMGLCGIPASIDHQLGRAALARVFESLQRGVDIQVAQGVANDFG